MGSTVYEYLFCSRVNRLVAMVSNSFLCSSIPVPNFLRFANVSVTTALAWDLTQSIFLLSAVIHVVLVRVRACVRASVRACVRACVRAWVRACVRVYVVPTQRTIYHSNGLNATITSKSEHTLLVLCGTKIQYSATN